MSIEAEEDEYGIIEVKKETQSKVTLAEDIKAAVDEVLTMTRENEETKNEWDILTEVLRNYVERHEKKKISPVPEPERWNDL